MILATTLRALRALSRAELCHALNDGARQSDSGGYCGSCGALLPAAGSLVPGYVSVPGTGASVGAGVGADADVGTCAGGAEEAASWGCVLSSVVSMCDTLGSVAPLSLVVDVVVIDVVVASSDAADDTGPEGDGAGGDMGGHSAAFAPRAAPSPAVALLSVPLPVPPRVPMPVPVPSELSGASRSFCLSLNNGIKALLRALFASLGVTHSCAMPAVLRMAASFTQAALTPTRPALDCPKLST
jgi:hypothetical protein